MTDGGEWVPTTEHDRCAAIATKMLDENNCNHELVPCYRPKGVTYMSLDRRVPWDGVAGLEMWWRPARTEPQKAQDRALADWMTACKQGLEIRWVDFLRGYMSGFAGLGQKDKDRVVLSFITDRFLFRQKGQELKSSFARYCLLYQDGILWQEDCVEKLIDEYLGDFKTRQESTFIEYLSTLPSPQASGATPPIPAKPLS